MKKIRLFNSIITSPLLLSAIAPILTTTSCNKNTVLQDLEESTIKEFTSLCKYPHSSDKFLYKVPYESNVKALSNYLKSRAEEITKGTVNQDIYGNIWFDVPANDDSLASTPTIALQAHMDMVFAYDPTKYEKGKEPDPLTTTIDIVQETVNGKRVIHSKDYKTTIGGDNGIGVAAILALIKNKEVKHGNLRVIFTNVKKTLCKVLL